MSEIRIYHNPRCSKSRETLALLQDQGKTVHIIEYLKDTPTEAELTDLLKKLGIKARELLRTKEDEYALLNLANTALTDSELVKTMAAHPKLIERPIVVCGNKARIGRPPENVLEILK